MNKIAALLLVGCALASNATLSAYQVVSPAADYFVSPTAYSEWVTQSFGPHPEVFRDDDNCRVVAILTEVENDEYKMVRTFTAPRGMGMNKVVTEPGGKPLLSPFFYRLNGHANYTGASLAYLFVWHYEDIPNFTPTTAYAKGGLKLNVTHSEGDTTSAYAPRGMAVIDLTDEIAQHAIRNRSLDIQVSFGSRDMRLSIPANYFLGFSEKADMGWGECAVAPPPHH